MFYALGLKTANSVVALTIQLTSHIPGIFADPIFKLKMWEQFLEMINWVIFNDKFIMDSESSFFLILDHWNF